MKKNSRLKKIISQVLVLALVLTQFQMVAPVGASADPLPPTWPNPAFNVTNLTPNSAAFTWTPAEDPDGIVAYSVYQVIGHWEYPFVGEPYYVFDKMTHTATVTEAAVNIPGLTPATEYEFKVEAVDNYGNWSTDGPAISFTTHAVGSGPTVLSSSPEAGTVNAPVTSSISVSFNEDIFHSVYFNDISLTSGATPVTIYTPLITGNTLTITPASQLAYGTGYQLIIPAGAVRNYVYEPLSSSYVLNFSTTEAVVNNAVYFPDANLEAAVRDALGRPDGDITEADLSNLTILVAGNMEISDLTGLQYATNLTGLYLYNNLISNLSPLSGLTNLTILSLGDNQISNLSPLSGLTNLTSLTLYNNQVSDLSHLSGLTNLTSLHLYGNNISNLSPLEDLVNLTSLDLEDNKLSDISSLTGLTNLHTLYLSSNQINDLTPLKDLTKIISLGLGENQISDLSPLSGLTNLTSLYLFSNEVINLTPIATLTKLSDLGLENNRISSISPLSGLNNLAYLFLDGNLISNISPLVTNQQGGGLVSGSYVSITHNLLDLSAGSTAFNAIQSLISSGIQVHYEPQNTGPHPPSGPRFAYIPNFNSNSVTVVDLGLQNVVKTIYGFDQPWAAAVNPSGNRVYVTNTGNNSVSVIDPFSHTITDTVYGTPDPLGAALSPDGTRLYVTNYGNGTVSVIDTAANQLLGSPIPVGANPLGIVVSPDGTTVYVANGGSSNVSIIDAATNSVSSTVPVGNEPYGLDVTPDGTRLYVTNKGSSVISVIDLVSGVVTEIEVGLSNRAIVISPNGKRVFSANYDTGTISIIDTVTNTVTGFVYAGTNPNGISVSPGGGLLSVANFGSNDLSIFDTNSLTLLEKVPVGSGPGAFGKFIKIFPPRRAYIPNSGDNTVSIIDAFTDGVDSAIDTAVVGTEPYGVAVSPDMKHAYITNSGSNTVSVIDIESNEVITTVPVGTGPRGAAANPQGTRVYVANENDNTITVINTSDYSAVSTVNLPANSHPQGIAVSPGGGRLYSANTGSNSVSIVNTLNNTVVKTVYDFSLPFGLIPVGDGSYVYVTNEGSNTVSMLDTRKLQVDGTVYVGQNPRGIAATPDGRKLYVTNFSDNTVTVINAAYQLNDVISTIDVGLGPVGVAVTPDGKQVYVVNSGSDTVSVINTVYDTVMETFEVGHHPTALGQFIGLGLKPRLTPPKVRDAVASGYNIKLIFDRILDETSIPAPADFSVLLNSAPAGVTNVDILGNRVELTLVIPVSTGQSMILDYTPGTKKIHEIAGMSADGLTGLEVWTNKPTLKTIFAESGSTQLNLHYNIPLNEKFVPERADFKVSIDGLQAVVADVQVIARDVFVTLDQPLYTDQNVTLDYIHGSNPLRDTHGMGAAPITGHPVDILLPDSFEPDNSFTEASLIYSDGSMQYHTIFNSSSTDVDWLKFEAVAGAEYIITTGNPSTPVHPVISLYDTDGSTLLNDNGIEPSIPLVWTAPAAGTYYLEVKHAIGWVGSYEISVVFTPAPDTTPPDWTDIALKIFNASQTGATLSWAVPADSDGSVVSYAVYSDGTLIGSTTNTSFDVTELTPGNLYSLSVRAMDSNGNWSVDLAASFSTASPSWSAGSLQASNITTDSLTLNWIPAYDSSSTVAYSVYQDGNLLATVDGSLDTLEITGLLPDTAYSLRIEAQNSYGFWSTSGPQISVTTLPPADVVPPSIIGTNPTGGNIGVYINNQIIIKFSENIKPGASIAGISLTTDNGTTAANFVYNITGDTLEIIPSPYLKTYTNYTVDIPADAVADFSNNNLNDSHTFSFTTSLFADPNLEAAIRETINKSSGPVTPGDMLALAVLKADDKSISDISGLEHATNLKHLYLGNNLIGDLSPLAGLESLEELWLDHNEIYDISSLSGLTGLKTLHMNHNLIAGIAPLADLSGLQALGLSDNYITDVSPLSGLTSLLGLSLGNNGISDISALKSLVNLQSLDLQAQTQPEGTAPILANISSVANMLNLRSLLLNDNSITNLAPLQKLTGLKLLTLWNNGITDSANGGIGPLAGISGLTDLWLDHNNINSLAPLASLTNLKVLSLAGNNNLSNVSPLVNNSGLGKGDYVFLPPYISSAEKQALKNKQIDVIIR